MKLRSVLTFIILVSFLFLSGQDKKKTRGINAEKKEEAKQEQKLDDYLAKLDSISQENEKTVEYLDSLNKAE